MKHLKTICFLVIIGILAISCVTTKNLPELRESRPRSILVLPPLNNSVEVDAPSVFLATSAMPLAESGYYVLPVTLTEQMFRQNGIQTAADAHNISIARLRQIFGADAALYIVITKFGVSFQVLSSIVQAEANAKLIDLKTGKELWAAKVTVNYQPRQTGGNTLLGTIAGAVVDQAINVLKNESFNAGKVASRNLLHAESPYGPLYGPYHTKYETD